MDDRIRRSDHSLYVAIIYPLVRIPVYDPCLENFIGERRGSARPDAQLNPPHIFLTPLPVYHYRPDPPPDNF